MNSVLPKIDVSVDILALLFAIVLIIGTTTDRKILILIWVYFVYVNIIYDFGFLITSIYSMFTLKGYSDYVKYGIFFVVVDNFQSTFKQLIWFAFALIVESSRFKEIENEED